MNLNLFRNFSKLTLLLIPALLLIAYVLPASARDFEEQCVLNTELSDTFAGERLGDKWSLYRPESASLAVENDQLVLTALEESVWYHEDSAFLAYQEVEGDVTLTATVHARRASDPSQPPDQQYQFGGLMLRDPASAQGDENYVFVVVGIREHKGAARLNVEYKTTQAGDSQVKFVDWTSGDAELRVDRAGGDITVSAREIGAESWQVLKTYQRPDLPETLQAGVIAYAFSNDKGIYDLQVAVDGVDYWTDCGSGN